MASFTAIRDALETNLQTISATLQVYARVPGQIVTPCAIVGVPEQVEFDIAMARGGDRWIIPIRVYVQASDYDSAQTELDGFLDSKSGNSVKLAIESDTTLGGVASTLRVQEAKGYGDYTIGNVDYLGAEWTVEVITQ